MYGRIIWLSNNKNGYNALSEHSLILTSALYKPLNYSAHIRPWLYFSIDMTFIFPSYKRPFFLQKMQSAQSS